MNKLAQFARNLLESESVLLQAEKVVGIEDKISSSGSSHKILFSRMSFYNPGTATLTQDSHHSLRSNLGGG